MTAAVITADPAQRGGYALIRIAGGASGLADPRFRLSRDGYEASVLGAGGWQVADALLRPLDAHADGLDLVLGVGPAVVDRLESGPVRLEVPSAGFDGPVFWPDLPLSRGGQISTSIAVPAAAEPRPPPLEGRQKLDPPVRPEEPPEPPRPAPRPPEPPEPALDGDTIRSRRLLPFALVGVLLLAVAGGGAWWALRQPSPTPPPVAERVPVPEPAPLSNPPAQRDCAHGSVADVVGCAQDPDAIFAVAQRQWDAGQSDEAVVLLQIASERGSGPAALRLAQLYDPNTFHAGGPIPQPNARQAAQYYRRAAEARQDAATAPREALRQRLQSDAEHGDTLAGLTLKDFWP
jgi:hypothetical protein